MFEKYENLEFISENCVLDAGENACEISNREFWNNVKKGLPKRFFSMESDFENIPELSATLYMDYFRTGSRSNFEDPYFMRRKALSYFTVCEAIENKGRYLDRIIDLLFKILQETTWVVPSHAAISDNSDCLPDANNEIIDLFAAETGATLSFVYDVLHNKFDSVSKNISPRIIKKLRHRIIDCYNSHNDFFWFGFDGRRVNNWNPWINSNILRIARTVCGHDEACKVMLKVMKSLDCYLRWYPEDGACDEGPVYWFKAGVCLMECIAMLKEYSGGTIDLYSQQKIKNTLEFYSKIYVGGGRAVNFADAASKSICSYGVLYHAAKAAGNTEMINFCADMKKRFCDTVPITLQEPWRVINLAEANNELGEPKAVKYPPEVYFNSIQLFTKRTADGIFFAAKGGNNDESHNHNDVGNFMIFKNTVPYVVDSGNMRYTRDTFSEKRYTIWTNRSEFHNLPTIGGCNQHEGALYKAENVIYKPGFFSVDIQNAYENSNDIVFWKRSFEFSGGVCVKDEYEFKKPIEITLNFLFALKPDITPEGFVFDGKFKMIFDMAQFNINCEEIELKDKLLENSWGDRLYRFCLKKKQTDSHGVIRYSFY